MWVGVEQSVIDDGSGAVVSKSAFEPQEDILNIYRDMI